MKRASSVLIVLFLMFGALAAQAKTKAKTDTVPALFLNARYVYVTSYDGWQFSPNLLPEDRQAISDTQNAINKWGKYVVVYNPEWADLIVVVQKRPTEDVLAVYDAKLGRDSSPLWWSSQRGGLDNNEMPLITKFQDAVNCTAKRKG